MALEALVAILKMGWGSHKDHNWLIQKALWGHEASGLLECGTHPPGLPRSINQLLELGVVEAMRRTFAALQQDHENLLRMQDWASHSFMSSWSMLASDCPATVLAA